MQATKKAKFFIALSITLLLGLFVVAISQIFILKNLERQNKELALMQQELNQKDEQADREKEYYDSEEYKEEYFRTHGNQKDGDITITRK